MRAQAAVLPGLGDAPRKPKGGYRLIPVVQLCMAWSAYRAGLIRLFDLRVYFACHEMVARRCLSAKTSLPSCFTLKELDRLTGLGAKRLKGSLGRLTAARLLIWSEAAIAFPGSAEGLPEEGRKVLTEMLDRIPNHERLVPVPRRTLRLLAGGARPALIATILGHLFRCLYLKKGCCQARGRCKASWIARVFGAGERRVKEARKELIRRGWLVMLKAGQGALNRWGAHVEINLAWDRLDGTTSAATAATKPLPGPSQLLPAATSTSTVPGDGPELAPPEPVPGPELAPPLLTQEPLKETYKNQKPSSGGPTGVCIHEVREEKTPETERRTASGASPAPARGESNTPTPTARPCPLAPPTLRNVTSEDLKDTGRLLELYRQAVAEGLVTSSERDRLRFVAAAEHAQVIGTRNAPGLFIRLVKGKLFHFLTQDDEDAANTRIKRHLFGMPVKPKRVGCSSLGGQSPSGAGGERPILSADAVLVRAVRAAATQARYRGDAFYLLKRERPEWTRERWDRAVSELESAQRRQQATSCFGGFASVGSLIPAAMG